MSSGGFTMGCAFRRDLHRTARRNPPRSRLVQRKTCCPRIWTRCGRWPRVPRPRGSHLTAFCRDCAWTGPRMRTGPPWHPYLPGPDAADVVLTCALLPKGRGEATAIRDGIQAIVEEASRSMNLTPAFDASGLPEGPTVVSLVWPNLKHRAALGIVAGVQAALAAVLVPFPPAWRRARRGPANGSPGSASGNLECCRFAFPDGGP